MAPTSPPLLLLPSPLLSPETWAATEVALTRRGYVSSTVGYSSGESWSEMAACVAHAAQPFEMPVLIAHSGAGQALPSACEAVGLVSACIFVDATIPKDGEAWIDSIPPGVRDGPAFREAAANGHAPNAWRNPSLWREVGVESSLADRLAAASPDVTMALYREPVRVPEGWPDLPAAYVGFVPNRFYAPFIQEARSIGWPVRELPGSHLHMVVDPGATATAIEELLVELGFPRPERKP